MISIIVTVNDYDILNSVLLNSLNKQTYTDYETIIVDSEKLGFSSASEALNYGALQAKGDLLLFVHQDVAFIDMNLLEKAAEFASRNEFGIAGVAGIQEQGEFLVYSSVDDGPEHKHAGKILKEVMNVAAVDECMFMIKRKNFEGFADLGKTWHFYAVDYSLCCKESGKRVCVVPLNIYHLSPGWSLNYNYFDTLYRVGKKHYNLNEIRTCVWIYKNTNYLWLYCQYRKLKIFIKHILKLNSSY